MNSSVTNNYLEIVDVLYDCMLVNSLSSRPDHGTVRIETVVKKSKSKPDLRFRNQNRDLNRSISGFGSGLESQNREPNRRFTVQWRFGRFNEGSRAVRSIFFFFFQKKKST